MHVLCDVTFRAVSMNSNRKVRKESAKPAGIVTFLGVYYLNGFAALTQIGVFWFSSKESFFPNTDVLMSILSICSTIIAGLYGITVAGFTFFLSRMDAMSQADSTVDYVGSSLKNKFKVLICSITTNVCLTLFISIALMYIPVSKELSEIFLYRLLFNEFVLFFFSSIGLIMVYSMMVIDPNSIQNEAEKLKKKISKPDAQPGNAAQFLSAYAALENACENLLPSQAVSQLKRDKGSRFVSILSLLYEQDILDKKALDKITTVHHYYACAVNCKTMRVSRQMCTLTMELLAQISCETQDRTPSM